MPNLSGPTWGAEGQGTPRQLIFLLHGLGSDGEDLIGLAPAAGPALPHALFIAPNAPERHDMGGPGYQWYSLRDYSPSALAAGARRAGPVLDAFIDAELAKHGLPPDAYALLGFSQGAMMALHTGLRRKTAPRAIVAMSGLLIDPLSLRAEMTCKPPVLLVHGEADGVVPVARSREAEKVLLANAVPVESLYIPELGHGIDEAALTAAVEFLRKSFE